MSTSLRVAPHGQSRLNFNDLAYLRAIAQGIPMVDAAKRFLGITHGAQLRLAHERVVALASAVAGRRLAGWPAAEGKISEQTPPGPSLEEWAEAEGLSDWSWDELQEMYRERFGTPNTRLRRRSAALERLRRQRLAMLDQLAELAAPPPSPADGVRAWLPERIASALLERGVPTLGELRRLIQQGGRWWTGLPAFGAGKAARLAAQIDALLGPAPPRLAFGGGPLELSGQHGANRAPMSPGGTDAKDDVGALRAWVSLRSNAKATARVYEREARRFLMWMQLERKRAVSDATAEDCRRYMDFLADVPTSWISRTRAAPGAPGWAPFAGQLDVKSQRLAVNVVNAWFAWMVRAHYLRSNPWELVQRRIGDAQKRGPRLTSRAFTPEAWRALNEQVERESDPMAAARWRWLLAFGLATGLRPAELIQAVRGDLFEADGGWWLSVLGKGSKSRDVVVPTAALTATCHYFSARGLDFEAADPSTPLLAGLRSPFNRVAYTTLSQALRRFVRRAVESSSLDVRERQLMRDASLHWLRHTHATRASEREVPADVLQANLGHADPRTTAGYYRAQQKRRRLAMEGAFQADEGPV